MTIEEFERKQRLKDNIQALKDMKDDMMAVDNWERMKRLNEACPAGAMAIQRIIKEDFGEREDEE